MSDETKRCRDCDEAVHLTCGCTYGAEGFDVVARGAMVDESGRTVEVCRHCGCEWVCPDCNGSPEQARLSTVRRLSSHDLLFEETCACWECMARRSQDRIAELEADLAEVDDALLYAVTTRGLSPRIERVIEKSAERQGRRG